MEFQKTSGEKEMIKRETPPCGDKECSCSTGIHGGITYGRGKLDELGFWEIPCRPCAVAADERRPQLLKSLGEPPENDPHAHDWAKMDAWPYE